MSGVYSVFSLQIETVVFYSTVSNRNAFGHFVTANTSGSFPVPGRGRAEYTPIRPRTSYSALVASASFFMRR